MKDEKAKIESKRNKTVQFVPLKDKEGNQIGEKKIFHNKKMNQPQYQDRTKLWELMNKLPKEKSKRQRKLRGEI